MQRPWVKYKLAAFYLFTFAISWTAWLVMFVHVRNTGRTDILTYAMSSLGGLGPLLSLLILERLSNNAIRLKDILARIQIRGARKRWFLPAIFFYPAATILGNIVYYIAGWHEKLRWIKPGPEELGLLVLPLIVVHFVASLITSPLFEEPGWRGFALGELQSRYGGLLGSLIVGGLWWLWHQPMNLTFDIQPTIFRLLSMLAFSFTIDSLFNLSGRNLFTAMLAHQSYGTLVVYLYEIPANLVTLACMIIFVVWLRTLEYRRRRSVSPSYA
jgi:membrane protease YdiL (CAAX protease family)